MLPEITTALKCGQASPAQLEALKDAPRDEIIALARTLKSEVDQQIQKDLARTETLVASLEVLATAAPHAQVRALAARGRAQLHHVSGNFAEARRLYRQAIALHLRLNESLEAARTRKTLMDVLMYLGLIDEASRMAARARLALAGCTDERLLAQLDTHEANLWQRREEFAHAIRLYRHAYTRFRKLDDAYGMAHVAFNLGNCHAMLDHVQRARRLYHIARRRYERLAFWRMVADTDYSLGYLDFVAGKIGPAIERLRQAGELFRAEGHEIGVALVELDLSEIMLSLNDMPRALRHAKRGALAFKKLALRLEEARTRLYAASSLMSVGDFAAAAGSLARARELIVAERNRVRLADLNLEHAHLNRMSGAVATAAAAYRDLALTYRSLGLPRREARALLHASAGLRELGSHVAVECANLAREKAREAADLRLLASAYELLADCGEGRARRLARQRRAALQCLRRLLPFMPSLFASGSLTEDATRMVQKLLQTNLDVSRRIDLIDQAHAIPLELMRGVGGHQSEQEREFHEELRWLYQRLYLDRRVHSSTSGTGAVGWRELEDRKLELEQALERSKLTRRVVTASEPLRNASRLTSTLDANETLLEYFPVDGRWSVAVVTRDHTEMIELDANVADTYRLCQALQIELLHVARAYPDAPSTARTAAARSVLGRLAECLLIPIRGAISRPDLVIAPHGYLWLVPFATLGLLSELGFESVVQTTSLADLHRARQRPARRLAHAAVLGGNDADLPSARDETETVRAYLAAHHLVVGPGELRHQAPADWIHIAGHGIRRDDNPYFAAIRTAQGFLSAADIAEMDLSTVELVVLSGCETGRGSLEAGRELGGLTLAFLGAGARAVLSSAWPVDDEATGALMRAFYHHVFTLGLGYGRALNRAQLECARDHRTRHPYYWGAFRLVGDCGSLTSTAQRRYS